MQKSVKQNHRAIDELPDAKAPSREAFGDTGFPFAEVEAVNAEDSEEHSENQSYQAVLLFGLVGVWRGYAFLLENWFYTID